MTSALETTRQFENRKSLRRLGKRLLRLIDAYFARCSLVPDEPVLDTKHFPWVADFERDWEAVRAELIDVLRHRDRLPRFQDISADQMRISPDDKWRTFFLSGFGYRSKLNRERCPRTSELLDKVPGLETAFFSILAPGKIIPTHRGITKGLVRGHLGLIVPTEGSCYMDVGDVRCTWQEGRVLLFDDTYPHGVANQTDHERVVLLFDFPRPMTWPGRLLRSVLFAGFRRTPYVTAALRNARQWEQSERMAAADDARLAGSARAPDQPAMAAGAVKTPAAQA